MLIVMSHTASQADIDKVIETVSGMGFTAAPIPGGERTAIGVLGNKGYVDDTKIRDLPGVQQAIHVSKPYKLVSRDFHPDNTIVDVAGVKIGEGERPVVVGGPCAVESEEQILKTAHFVKKAGADLLRGGAFKPRTGPHTFQGLREEGLKLLAKARAATGKRSLVTPMSKAALVAGAHGVLVEVHPEPEKALSDGPQSLTFPGFEALMADLRRLQQCLACCEIAP